MSVTPQDDGRPGASPPDLAVTSGAAHRESEQPDGTPRQLSLDESHPPAPSTLPLAALPVALPEGTSRQLSLDESHPPAPSTLPPAAQPVALPAAAPKMMGIWLRHRGVHGVLSACGHFHSEHLWPRLHQSPPCCRLRRVARLLCAGASPGYGAGCGCGCAYAYGDQQAGVRIVRRRCRTAVGCSHVMDQLAMRFRVSCTNWTHTEDWYRSFKGNKKKLLLLLCFLARAIGDC